ncbi:type II toxin-antitoxin system antitoxin SocA domain-containing protein [Mucilaginibacter sp. AW1-7]|uniref:type II toxin-antitoxin system antitoxin SocA domain-containing protein n=1 Tax=Mucilaginibacter sp. AW1-7 TaxID=3349874 RepID=UPI003F736AD9
MSVQTKLAAFDYVVFRLSEWYTEKNGQWQNNDLSRLKVTKLLFFVTAVSSTSDNPGLLNVFDNFAAMPYGHVESEIQDHMHESLNYDISKSSVSFKEGVANYQPDAFVDANTRLLIEQAVAKMKLINNDLINYNAFKLVDLSHRWQSWKTIFSLAKRNGKFSMPIPKQMIMIEPKILK